MKTNSDLVQTAPHLNDKRLNPSARRMTNPIVGRRVDVQELWLNSQARNQSPQYAVIRNHPHKQEQGTMALSRIPTYAEIAAFRESIIKTRKSLSPKEMETMQDKLALMEYRCLRAINTLNDRTDSDLMKRAQQRSRLAP